MPIIDLESNVSIRELFHHSKGGTVDIDPNAYFQRFALNTSLTLNYGIRIDGSIDNELLKEICHVERIVSNFRSTSNNWQDYVPLLRLWPSRNSEAKEFRIRRDKYLTLLLDMLRERIKNGTDKPCITGNILKDPDAKLNEGELGTDWNRSGFTQNISKYISDMHTPCSRDQIDLPYHGFRWPRHRAREHNHGHRLPRLGPRPTDPSPCLR